METLLQDIRYAFRTLLRTPGWTAMAVVTLGLGTGANTAVFSFVDALLFRPPPGVRAPGRVVSIFTSDFSSGPYGDTSYPDYLSMAGNVTAFETVAAEDDSLVAPIRIGDEVERVRISQVSGRYFSLLGLKPALGRVIADSDVAQAEQAIVISHAFWKRAFGGRSDALGATIKLNETPYIVVGVAPARFRGMNLGRGVDLWAPIVIPENTPDARQNRGLAVLARLGDGATLRDAQEQLSALAARLAHDFPTSNLGTLERPREPRPMLVAPATRIGPRFRGQVVSLAAVLMGGVGLVLLLACANVASLLLSRSTTRAREVAVRRALGAGSRRLVRQLLTETAVLSFAAAGLGLLIAAWTTDILPSFFPTAQASLLETSPGWRVLAYAIAIGSLSSIAVGIVPAVRSLKPPLAFSLRSHGDVADRAGTRMRNALVSVQVAIACVLLVGAALLVQSVTHTLAADLGFGAKEAVLVAVELPGSWSPAAAHTYLEEARERVATLPGVASAAWVSNLALEQTSRRGFAAEGYTRAPREDRELNYTYASAGYFETLRIPLRQGRTFTRDDAEAPPLAIVNDTLARRLFGGNAVGKHLTDSHGTVLEIVGVVGDTAHVTVSEPPVPLVYYPVEQSLVRRLTLVARTRAAAEPAADAIRRSLSGMNQNVAVLTPQTMRAHIQEALGSERLTASLVSVCGGLALVLAVVGLYGAIAYLVTRRTREIGVRMALGATPRRVQGLVVAHGVWIAGVGLAAGLVCAATIARLVPLGLYGVAPLDPRTYAAVAIALALTAVLAAVIPARRAVRIDPARALSSE